MIDHSMREYGHALGKGARGEREAIDCSLVRAEHRSECQSHAGIYMTKERVAYKVSLTPFW